MPPPDAPSSSDPQSRPEAQRVPTLRVVTMPRDTNHYGTIFGGVILSYLDQAAFVQARTHGQHRWVTAAIDRVDFRAPVHTGDIVSFYAGTVREGTKSVTIAIDVQAQRFSDGSSVHVTSATMTMVAVDNTGTPIPFRSPPTQHEP